MLKSIRIVFIVCLIMFCNTGFAEINIDANRTTEIQKITEELINYRNKGDYDSFVKNFTPELKQSFLKENIENLCGNLHEKLGKIKQIKVIKKERKDTIDTIRYLVDFEKNDRPYWEKSGIEVVITVDEKNIVHDFYFYHLSDEEINQVAKLMVEPFFEALDNDDYESWKKLFAATNPSYISKEAFGELKKTLKKEAGNIQGWYFFKESISDIKMESSEIPARKVDVSFVLFFEKKYIPFSVLPIEYKYNDLQFGNLDPNKFKTLDSLLKYSALSLFQREEDKLTLPHGGLIYLMKLDPRFPARNKSPKNLSFIIFANSKKL